MRFGTFGFDGGLREGEYILTFVWEEVSEVTGAFQGPAPLGRDRLGNKYMDPRTSKFTLTVTPDGPNDLGRINLKVGPELLEESENAND